jgi:hypothetical protein
MNESEQFKTICKGEFAHINKKLDRMFIDNGNESFQSKLNRHDQFLKRVTRIGYIITIPLIGISISGGYKFVMTVIAHLK